MASTSGETLSIKLAFGGGTELLLAPPRSKKQTVEIPKFVPANENASSSITQPDVTAPVSAPTPSTMSTSTSAPRRSDMRYLVKHIREHLIVEREELFVDADGQGM